MICFILLVNIFYYRRNIVFKLKQKIAEWLSRILSICYVRHCTWRICSTLIVSCRKIISHMSKYGKYLILLSLHVSKVYKHQNGLRGLKVARCQIQRAKCCQRKKDKRGVDVRCILNFSGKVK